MLKLIAVVVSLMLAGCVDDVPDGVDAGVTCEAQCELPAAPGVYGLCPTFPHYDRCVRECSEAWPSGSWCALAP